MLILLPPSEGKAAPARRGRPVDLDALSFPELRPTRRRILDALVATSALPDAPARLMAGARVADEVARNARLASLPARPALEVYTGVLCEALGAATLSTAARRRAAARLVVVSGLWGAVRPGDRIPPYRMHVCAKLVGLGGLEPMWREVLPEVLAAAAGRRGVVVDLRSSSYLAMGAPAGLAERTVTVRVVREVDGRRSVVSHLAKHTRGLVARHLLESGAAPRTPEGLVDALADRWATELAEPARPGRPWTLEVVTS
ncbi:MAG: peroxide stress protein YaaA [Actinomycetales bacterium]|nr:peroxide stress protein YaaA [Actinomycetales bacterium]